MPQDAADIGANFSDYKGEAALGGSSVGVIKIDTHPLEQLAQYTMEYNKVLWTQQQKDADEQMKEMAKMYDIDVNLLHGKDKEEIVKWLSIAEHDAIKYAKKDIPTDPTERINHRLEWKKTTAGLFNRYETAKQRTIAYHSQIDAIDNDGTLKDNEKTQRKAEVEAAFEGSDVSTQLPVLGKYIPKVIDIPKTAEKDVVALKAGSNDNITTETKMRDYATSRKLAAASLVELHKRIPKEVMDENGIMVTNPEYRALSPEAKIENDRQAATPSTVKDGIKMVDPLNQAIHKMDASNTRLYFDADGNFLENKFLKDFKDNTAITDAYDLIKQHNQAIDDDLADAARGVYKDRGIEFVLPSTFRSKELEDSKIDLSKPLEEVDLVSAAMTRDYKGNQVKKSMQHHGEGEDTRRAVRVENIQQAGANARTKKEQEEATKRAQAKAGTTTPGARAEFWATNILPQLQETDFKKAENHITPGVFSKPKDLGDKYTGDVRVAPDAISGIDILAQTITTPSGKPMAITGDTKVYIRYKDGVPIGILINKVYMSAKEVDIKANQFNADKTSKGDPTLFPGKTDDELTDPEYYQRNGVMRTRPK